VIIPEYGRNIVYLYIENNDSMCNCDTNIDSNKNTHYNNNLTILRITKQQTTTTIILITTTTTPPPTLTSLTPLLITTLGMPEEVVIKNYRRDGSAFWNLIHIMPVSDVYGKVRTYSQYPHVKSSNCIVLYCIVLYCIVLYCIVLYCIVLYCIVLYCIVL
jgi:hypothetical protein